MTDIRTIYMLNTFDLKINKREVLKYLRVKKSDEALDNLISESINDVYKAASPKAVFIESNIEICDDIVKFDFMTVKSHSLSVNLKECKKAYIFASTLGLEVDRLIEKYSKFLQSKSVVCHAVGSALIESFCDYVNETLIENRKATKRFSPGYGDLSLDIQKNILTTLDANRKIGITLNDSLIMKPSKSVTAIIGIK